MNASVQQQFPVSIQQRQGLMVCFKALIFRTFSTTINSPSFCQTISINQPIDISRQSISNPSDLNAPFFIGFLQRCPCSDDSRDPPRM